MVCIDFVCRFRLVLFVSYSVLGLFHVFGSALAVCIFWFGLFLL